MDYKEPLHMPKTAFEMRGNLTKKEPGFQKRWQDEKLYEKMLEKREGATPFVLHDGPPYANGDIHLGHALNKVLKDVIVKSHFMEGYNTPYIPGWDTHGLPIETAVTDADVVGNMASATIAGLKDYNVIGCAKHFPGHGDTATDSHYGLPIVNKSKAELLNNELKPYKIAINQGIEMIMTAHILYPQLDNTTVVSERTGNEEKKPATMSKAIITDLLKGEMGFNGVVSTDAMNMKAIADTFGQVQAVKLAIEAGADLICMPTVLYSLDDVKNLDAIIDGVEDAVKKGEIS